MWKARPLAEGISIGDAVLNVRGDFKEVEAGIESFRNRAEGSLAGAATRIGASFTVMGGAITGALGLMVNEAAGFQSAMAEVNTLGIKDLGALEDTVKSLSSRFAVDLKDGAKAAYQAISAGASEAEAPLLLEKAAIAAKAGVTDLTTAIELGTSVSNAFGLSMKDVGLIYDQAFIAVKGGVTTFEELSSAVGKVAPLMSAAGLSTGEMFAAVSALTKGGLSTSEAVTSLKAALSGIVKPTSEAKNMAALLNVEFDAASLRTKGLKVFLDDLGTAIKEKGPELVAMRDELAATVEGWDQMAESNKAQAQALGENLEYARQELEQVKQQYGANSQEAMEYGQQVEQLAEQHAAVSGSTKDTKSALADLKAQYKELEGVSEDQLTMMSIMFGSVEGLGGVLALTGNQAASFAEQLTQMEKAQGATDEAFQSFMDANPAFAFEQLKATMALLSVELGQALLPNLIEMARAIIPVVQSAIEWVKNNQELIGTILTVVGSIGLFLATAGPIILALAGISSAITSVSVIAPLLAAAFVALAGPVGIAVAALVAAGALIITNWEGIKEGAGVIWDGIVAIVTGAWEGMVETWDFWTNAIRNIFQAFVGWIGDGWSGVKSIFSTAAGIVKGVWDAMTETFQGGVDLVKSVFKGFMDGITGFWDTLIGSFKSAMDPLKQAWNMVTDVFNGALNVIGGIADRIVSVINKPFEVAGAFIDWLFGIFGGGGGGLSAPIPQYATGTNFAPGGPSILGETGQPELVIGPTVANLAKGSTVLNPRDTASLLNGGGRGPLTVSFSYPNARFDTPEAANYWNRKAVKDLQRAVTDRGEDL